MISLLYGSLSLSLVDRGLDLALQALQLVSVGDLDRGLFVQE